MQYNLLVHKLGDAREERETRAWTTSAKSYLPKKLAILFMPFLLTFAKLLSAWLAGCFVFITAAVASSFVCIMAS